MKKYLKIVAAFAFPALPNLFCIEQEFDVEIAINSKSNSAQVIQEEQKLDKQPAVLLVDSDDAERGIEIGFIRPDNAAHTTPNVIQRILPDDQLLINFREVIIKDVHKIVLGVATGVIVYKLFG